MIVSYDGGTTPFRGEKDRPLARTTGAAIEWTGRLTLGHAGSLNPILRGQQRCCLR